MSFALPSTDSSFARPRPGRTTARSPGRASPSPLRSTTSGVPGTKNGSPTTSFPRRVISTTTRSAISGAIRWRLDLQEPADGEARPGRPEQQPRPEQDQRVQREGEGTDVVAG